jgi:hypothetical protein
MKVERGYKNSGKQGINLNNIANEKANLFIFKQQSKLVLFPHLKSTQI